MSGSLGTTQTARLWANIQLNLSRFSAAPSARLGDFIVPTDNGIQFTNRKRDTSAFEHIFDRVCREHKIQHRLAKVKHPWINGQVERMNRTIKKATVKRFHYDTHDQLERHLADFLDAYNYARRWKTLSGLTPYEFICKTWTNEPKRFNVEPGHHMTGLKT